MENEPPTLEMRNITKRFPGVVANDSIDLKSHRGEILALLGENGAGKSTLMKILTGVHSQDEGEIYINGDKVNIESPNQSEAHGIAMVYQHFMLVEKLTVLENIALGVGRSQSLVSRLQNQLQEVLDGNRPKFSSDRSEIRAELEELSKRYDIEVDLDARVWGLDVGERQKVEILKALYKDSQILILDEPTAVLTPQESEKLFDIIKEIVSDGLSVIFITHRLEEVISHADRTTVIRDGKVVGSVDPTTATESDLAEMMVGEEVLLDIDQDRSGEPSDDTVLRTIDLNARDKRGNPALKNVNLEVNKGEIVGIAGVSGNGQSQLAECLAGIRSVEGGKLYFNSKPIEDKNRQDFIDAGIYLIPEDRHKFGSVPEQTVLKNSILGHHQTFADGPFLNSDRIEQYSEELVEEFDVKVPDVSTPAASLSGGNLQKLICGRELKNEPSLLIANQPTRGVDVGAIEKIRELLLEKRDEDVGIVLISENLDELFQMSDRLVVLYDGEIVYEDETANCDRKTVGRYMGGKGASIDEDKNEDAAALRQRGSVTQ